MSEYGMRGRVVKALRKFDAISVENPAYPGTPDVNYVEGWVELKWARDWPVKPSTPLAIEHFTPQQRVWLTRRWLLGGNVWLLLCCGGEWLLFTGVVAADTLGKSTREELIAVAHKTWLNGLNEEELVASLTLTRTAVKGKVV